MTLDEARAVLTQTLGQEQDMVLPNKLRAPIELAIASHDQLRMISGLGGAFTVSFDQTAVEAVARMHGIDVTPAVARDLMVLQQEGLRLMREAA